MSLAHFRARSLSLFALACIPEHASAGILTLSSAGTIDISALDITSIGDLGFAAGRIWVADGSAGGKVRSVSTLGTPLETLHPDQFAGINQGADALTTISTTNLGIFSGFGESVGVRVSWTTATVVSTYPSGYSATGADHDGSGLWVASCPTAGGGATLLRLDISTGAVLDTIPVQNVTARIADLALDPASGALYALFEDSVLREIDKTTGAVLSSQSLAAITIEDSTLAAGIEFDTLGTHFYVASGTGTAADTIFVLDRKFSRNVCASGIGENVCPCTPGTLGRGCRHSVAGNTGAFMSSTGIPRTVFDSFVLQAEGLPPGTSVLFFQGHAGLAVGTAFGDGLLCLAGPHVRLAIKTAPSGTASYPEASDAHIHVTGAIPPAATVRRYQAWYRDSATFCTASTFNLTNGISVDWFP